MGHDRALDVGMLRGLRLRAVSLSSGYANVRRPAIELREVTMAFGSEREFVALSSVDLEIFDGEFIALVGTSGCGKTTILNLVAGLLEATSGDVWVDGQPSFCPNLDIGYMFARDALLPWRTAVQNVELSLETRSDRDRRQRRERANAMLDLVGLSDATDRYRAQLSQGMRQRVSLARTLAPDPKILLMDEPFAAVDARTRLDLQAQFLKIWEGSDASRNGKKTVIFVTHDLHEATLLADRVIVMHPHPGRITWECTIDLPRPRADRLSEIMFADSFQFLHRQLFDRLETGAAPRTTASVSS
jgi:NitT/TauT family transport system ATP-binding protein